MSDDTRIDREAGEAVKRLERQQFLDGKLDKAYAADGAGILFLPAVFAVVGLVGWVLTSAGLDGPAAGVVSVPLLIGLGLLAVRRTRRG